MDSKETLDYMVQIHAPACSILTLVHLSLLQPPQTTDPRHEPWHVRYAALKEFVVSLRVWSTD